MVSGFFVTNGITLLCLIYTILVSVLFFLKGKINRVAGKLFMAIVFASIISMGSYMLWGVFAQNNSPSTELFGRIYIFITVCLNYILGFYITLALKPDEDNRELFKDNKTLVLITTLVIIFSNLAACIFLPVSFVQETSSQPCIISGALSQYLNITSTMVVAYIIFTIFMNRKKLDNITKVLSILSLVVLGTPMIIKTIGSFHLNDTSYIYAIIVMFLYLSIESQDLALLLEFNEATRKAEESNRLKGEFIMNMSHKLRTPMNSILGFSNSLLSQEELTLEGVQEDTESIRTASNRLFDLINAILDISKLESEKEVLNEDNYKLDSIMYDISSRVNAKITKEGLTFEITADETCPNDLYGDAYKLNKILNLLLNYIVKHTDNGDINLNISSTTIDQENHEVIFNLKTSKQIMKEDSFNRSFDDIIKLSSDSEDDIDADTLRFIAAKGLVGIIGGTIEFASSKQEGTQYTIKLKQKATSENKIGNIKERIQTIHTTMHSALDLTGKNILIIDDKKINSIILERMLPQYNATIEVTAKPREGISKATEKYYDAVFVDYQMEEMSGEDVIKKLEATGNRMPPIIALITGANEITKESNYTSFIECPIEYRDLNKVMNDLFRDKE